MDFYLLQRQIGRQMKTRTALQSANSLLLQFASVYFSLLGIALVLVIFAEYIFHSRAKGPDEVIALSVLAIAIGAFVMGYAQARLTILQMQQTKTLAERRDDALIAAIDALTTELGRRPAQNPATVQWALFNLPVKR